MPRRRIMQQVQVQASDNGCRSENVPVWRTAQAASHTSVRACSPAENPPPSPTRNAQLDKLYEMTCATYEWLTEYYAITMSPRAERDSGKRPVRLRPFGDDTGRVVGERPRGILDVAASATAYRFSWGRGGRPRRPHVFGRRRRPSAPPCRPGGSGLRRRRRACASKRPVVLAITKNKSKAS